MQSVGFVVPVHWEIQKKKNNNRRSRWHFDFKAKRFPTKFPIWSQNQRQTCWPPLWNTGSSKTLNQKFTFKNIPDKYFKRHFFFVATGVTSWEPGHLCPDGVFFFFFLMPSVRVKRKMMIDIRGHNSFPSPDGKRAESSEGCCQQSNSLSDQLSVV